MSAPHTIDRDKYRPHFALFAGAASLVTVAVLIAAKALAYWHSGSASVFGSLMDSIVDATGSAVNFLAIHLSLKPADKNHRSGHGKIEGLAALVQALLIFGGGVSLVYEAGRRFIHPGAVADSDFALLIMVFSIAASFGLVMLQKRVLSQAPSLAVQSDKVHYSMDIVVNAGVIVVLMAMKMGAPGWTDPVFALLIAIYLGVTAKDIAKSGLDMLLDRELPGQTRKHIIDTIAAQAGVLGVHDLRTGQSGMRVVMSFDIEVDPDLKLLAAHEIARGVEGALLEQFPHADIMIHVDPHGDTDDSRHVVERVHGSRGGAV
jgi:ferrous-iron efflux pump FieF